MIGKKRGCALGPDVDDTVRRIGFGFDALGHLATATSYNDPTSGDVVNQVEPTGVRA